MMKKMRRLLRVPRLSSVSVEWVSVENIKLTIKLERLSKDWNSPVYIFFKPTPLIEYIKDRCVHVFECNAKHCKGKGNGRMVRRYLDTGDAKSTSNLRKHAKICWGEETVAAADQTRDIDAAREALKKIKDGSITEAFERVAKKGKLSYSHRQHTTTESRCVSLPHSPRTWPDLKWQSWNCLLGCWEQATISSRKRPWISVFDEDWKTWISHTFYADSLSWCQTGLRSGT